MTEPRSRPLPLPVNRTPAMSPARSPVGLQLPPKGGVRGRVMGDARPGRITAPTRANVAAFSPPQVLDRWNAGIHAAGDIGANVITIYDVIGEDYWSGGGFTVNRLDAALRQIGKQDIEVHINSPGGDMFEGIACYNRLLEHPGQVTVKVMGLAASAASIIAMAGHEIQIGPASFLMIHNCWVMAIGNRHDMADTAAFLEPFDDAMAGVYAERSGLKKAEVVGLMDAETWMSGSVAVAKGFANKLLSSSDVEEDTGKSASARDTNAIRQAELGLCKSMSRTDARALLAKIKGTPGAAQDDLTPGAEDTDWLADAGALLESLRS